MCVKKCDIFEYIAQIEGVDISEIMTEHTKKGTYYKTMTGISYLFVRGYLHKM